MFLKNENFFNIHADCVVATGWQTVPVVSATWRFGAKFYFVQDYEPAFYPMGSHALAAEMSYRHKDFACICASSWLNEIMQNKYGLWSKYFNLAYDKNIYFPRRQMKKANEMPRIAVYARLSTARRAVELAFLGLEVLAARGVAFKVDLFGADLPYYVAPFPCTMHGILNSKSLSDLYSETDIGVCFSATNYSLVPQEMMACGLPVLELDVESTRAIFPEGAVTLALPTPTAIADQLESLLKDENRRSQQAQIASTWVDKFTWEGGAKIIERALVQRLIDLGHINDKTPQGDNRVVSHRMV